MIDARQNDAKPTILNSSLYGQIIRVGASVGWG